MTAISALDSTTASFVLSRPHRTVFATGGERSFRRVPDALAALRDGSATHIVGALPFDPAAPAALWAPEAIRFQDGPLCPAIATLPEFELAEAVPEPDRHRERVRTAVEQMSAPGARLRKVVLARALRLRAAEPVVAADILDRLVSGDPGRNGFLVDLTDGGRTGNLLVGSTPEVLVRREGRRVSSYPLAGSMRRTTDPYRDREIGAALLNSSKNLAEHRYVVDHVRAALAAGTADVRAPLTPELTHTPALWHLGTPITATARPGVGALELAAALHPTPAICGTPAAAAARMIAELEGDRGFYAGAVGWCDAEGNGEWMVSIRCAELDSDGLGLTAFAGGGILAESDPDDEFAETTTKFETMLGALGLTGEAVVFR
ncbi:MAG: isochorismate synthase [Nocardia sp.]|nr:isochorismate synthase [Nocardia sp.]